MIFAAPRENTAPRPEGPMLVFQEQSCPHWRSRRRGLRFHVTSLESALIQMPLPKSFRMRIYRNKDLKSPGMNTYKKSTGGVGLTQRGIYNAIPFCLRLMPLK